MSTKADETYALQNLIQRRITDLQTDPDGIVDPNKDRSLFQFQTQGESWSKNGVWVDSSTSRLKTVRIIGELAYDLTEYADLKIDSRNVNESRLESARWRWCLCIPSELELPIRYKKLLRNQYKLLSDLEALQEGDPPFSEVESGRATVPPKNYKINRFIKVPSKGAFDLVIVSDRAWYRDQQDETEEISTLYTDDDIETKGDRTPPLNPSDLNENGDVGLVSTPASNVVATENIVVGNQQSKPDKKQNDSDKRETLLTWPDTQRIFTGLKTNVKKSFYVNDNLAVYDSDGNKLHPTKYKNSFHQGTWVMADVALKLWDMTNPTSRDKSKTYQLFMHQLCAINKSSKPVENQSTSPNPLKRKASSMSDIGDSSVLPPIFKPFQFGTSSNEPSGTQSSTNSADANKPLDTQSSTSAESNSTTISGSQSSTNSTTESSSKDNTIQPVKPIQNARKPTAKSKSATNVVPMNVDN